MHSEVTHSDEMGKCLYKRMKVRICIFSLAHCTVLLVIYRLKSK